VNKGRQSLNRDVDVTDRHCRALQNGRIAGHVSDAERAIRPVVQADAGKRLVNLSRTIDIRPTLIETSNGMSIVSDG
jgi:hypothetical protein